MDLHPDQPKREISLSTIKKNKIKNKKTPNKKVAMLILYFDASLVVYFCLSPLYSLTCFGHSQDPTCSIHLWHSSFMSPLSSN